MTEERKNPVEEESDVLSDDELESIAGGHGGAAGKRTETGRPIEPEKDTA